MSYRKICARSPDTRAFGIEDGGFVNVSSANQAAIVSALVWFGHWPRLTRVYLVST